MTRDDTAWLRALHAQFDTGRFTLQQIHRRVCNATRPMMRPEQRAEYEQQLQRLHRYVDPSPGPRGGPGYCLNGHALRYLAAVQTA